MGAKNTFFGVFFSSAREKFSPEISVFAAKISLTGSFCLEFAQISTFADEEKEEEVIFHPLKQTNRDENGHISLKKGERERKYKGECDETRTEQKKKNGKMPNIPERKIKMGKVVLKQDSRDRKTKGHHGKAKGQNQKASIHKQAKQIVSLPSPTPLEKYKPTFSQNFSSFRDFLPCFISNLPTPHKIPFNPTRRTRAYAHIRARALSEFPIFAFTLHLNPQQTVDQSFECEGKPCVHLHLHRNNLKFNILHDIRCKKSVKAKG